MNEQDLMMVALNVTRQLSIEYNFFWRMAYDGTFHLTCFRYDSKPVQELWDIARAACKMIRDHTGMITEYEVKENEIIITLVTNR